MGRHKLWIGLGVLVALLRAQGLAVRILPLAKGSPYADRIVVGARP